MIMSTWNAINTKNAFLMLCRNKFVLNVKPVRHSILIPFSISFSSFQEHEIYELAVRCSIPWQRSPSRSIIVINCTITGTIRSSSTTTTVPKSIELTTTNPVQKNAGGRWGLASFFLSPEWSAVVNWRSKANTLPEWFGRNRREASNGPTVRAHSRPRPPPRLSEETSPTKEEKSKKYRNRYKSWFITRSINLPKRF